MKTLTDPEVMTLEMWIIKKYGERCPNYNPDCQQCRVWRQWENFKDALYKEDIVVKIKKDIKEMLILIKAFTKEDTEGEEVLEKWTNKYDA